LFKCLVPDTIFNKTSTVNDSSIAVFILRRRDCMILDRMTQQLNEEVPMETSVAPPLFFAIQSLNH
jgi:hypothetical protein